MSSITEPVRLYQKGFTLVELMIALVLGLIVIGGSLALFITQRATSGLSNQMAEVQSEGRIALDAMARDMRAAGDFGCWPVSNPTINKLNNATAFSESAGGLIGYDSGTSVPSTGSYGVHIVKEASPATDSSVLALFGVTGSLSNIASGHAMAAMTEDLVIKRPTQDFQTNDVAVVTDCINWTKFQVTGVTTDGAAGTQVLAHAAGAVSSGMGGGNADATLGVLFGVGATVGRLDAVWWYVAQNPTTKQNALYRMSARDSAPLLVSNRVERMVVTYNLASVSGGTVDVLDKSASAVTDWTAVRSARIQILVRSNKQIMVGAQPAVSFAGASVSVGNHAYLPVQMTVSLRNQ